MIDPRLLAHPSLGTHIRPGRLGDSWLLSAASFLILHPECIEYVIPDAEYQQKSFLRQGLCRFRFFHHGYWVNVVIDDFLPMDPDNQLVFASSREMGEYWPALMEKAYAKLLGSYAMLDRSDLPPVAVALSGGMVERVDLSLVSCTESLIQLLTESLASKTLLSCNPKKNQQVYGDPFHYQHTISIRDILKVRVRLSNLRRKDSYLLKLYKPWKTVDIPTTPDNTLSTPLVDEGFVSQEYGLDHEWKQVPQREWMRLGIDFSEKGVFFVTMEDFLSRMGEMYLCRCVSPAKKSNSLSFYRNYIQFIGFWSKYNKTAGGSENSDFIPQNPQYLITVKEKTLFMISLLKSMQTVSCQGKSCHPLSANAFKSSSSNYHLSTRKGMDSIGIFLFKVEINRKYRIHSCDYQLYFFTQCLPVVENSVKIHLDRGQYIVIPVLKRRLDEGSFVLRFQIHSPLGQSSPLVISPLDKDGPTTKPKSVFSFKEYPVGVFKLVIVAYFIKEECDSFEEYVCQVLLKDGRKTHHHTTYSTSLMNSLGEYLQESDLKSVAASNQSVQSMSLDQPSTVYQHPPHESFVWPICRPREAWLEIQVFLQKQTLFKTTKKQFQGIVNIQVNEFTQPSQCDQSFEMDAIVGADIDHFDDRKGTLRLKLKYERL